MRRIDGLTSSRLKKVVVKTARQYPLGMAVALIAALVAILFLFRAGIFTAQAITATTEFYPPLPTKAVDSPARASSEPGVPLRLIVPSIGINAEIEKVGLTKSGAMAVPKNTDATGWFELGYRPGQFGSAVITGHVDTLWLRPAVFAKIGELTAGQMLTVEDDAGKSYEFVVTRTAKYLLKDLPLDEIFGASSQPKLNLITCSGKWSWKAGSYSERTVVYSEALP